MHIHTRVTELQKKWTTYSPAYLTTRRHLVNLGSLHYSTVDVLTCTSALYSVAY